MGLGEKKNRLLFTFHTTTEAMAFEEAMEGRRELGRLIPAPGSVRAGCGLAWRANPKKKDEIMGIIEAKSVAYEDSMEVVL